MNKLPRTKVLESLILARTGSQSRLGSWGFPTQNRKGKAVFFDRDGVLIEDVGGLISEDQIKPILGAIQAIKKVKKAGFYTVVVSNQSVVARGLISEEQLKKIDNTFRAIFAKSGAVIDLTCYCPHHPDFTQKCKCRKPEIGLFKKAKRDLNLSMKDSYIIGDHETDIIAGRNAGCRKSVIVGQNESTADCVTKDVLLGVEWILKDYA